MKGITAGQEYLEFLPVGAQPKLGSPGVLAWAMVLAVGTWEWGQIKLFHKEVWAGLKQKKKKKKTPNEVHDSLQQEHCPRLDNPLPSCCTRGVKAAGTGTGATILSIIYSPYHVAVPRTHLLGHSPFSFYCGHSELKKTSVVYLLLQLPTYSSLSLPFPKQNLLPPLLRPRGTSVLRRGVGRDWVSLREHTQTHWPGSSGGMAGEVFQQTYL